MEFNKHTSKGIYVLNFIHSPKSSLPFLSLFTNSRVVPNPKFFCPQWSKIRIFFKNNQAYLLKMI